MVSKDDLRVPALPDEEGSAALELGGEAQPASAIELDGGLDVPRADDRGVLELPDEEGSAALELGGEAQPASAIELDGGLDVPRAAAPQLTLTIEDIADWAVYRRSADQLLGLQLGQAALAPGIVAEHVRAARVKFQTILNTPNGRTRLDGAFGRRSRRNAADDFQRLLEVRDEDGLRSYVETEKKQRLRVEVWNRVGDGVFSSNEWTEVNGIAAGLALSARDVADAVEAVQTEYEKAKGRKFEIEVPQLPARNIAGHLVQTRDGLISLLSSQQFTERDAAELRRRRVLSNWLHEPQHWRLIEDARAFLEFDEDEESAELARWKLLWALGHPGLRLGPTLVSEVEQLLNVARGDLERGIEVGLVDAWLREVHGASHVARELLGLYDGTRTAPRLAAAIRFRLGAPLELMVTGRTATLRERADLAELAASDRTSFNAIVAALAAGGELADWLAAKGGRLRGDALDVQTARAALYAEVFEHRPGLLVFGEAGAGEVVPLLEPEPMVALIRRELRWLKAALADGAHAPALRARYVEAAEKLRRLAADPRTDALYLGHEALWVLTGHREIVFPSIRVGGPDELVAAAEQDPRAAERLLSAGVLSAWLDRRADVTDAAKSMATQTNDPGRALPRLLWALGYKKLVVGDHVIESVEALAALADQEPVAVGAALEAGIVRDWLTGIGRTDLADDPRAKSSAEDPVPALAPHRLAELLGAPPAVLEVVTPSLSAPAGGGRVELRVVNPSPRGKAAFRLVPVPNEGQALSVRSASGPLDRFHVVAAGEAAAVELEAVLEPGAHAGVHLAELVVQASHGVSPRVVELRVQKAFAVGRLLAELLLHVLVWAGLALTFRALVQLTGGAALVDANGAVADDIGGGPAFFTGFVISLPIVLLAASRSSGSDKAFWLAVAFFGSCCLSWFLGILVLYATRLVDRIAVAMVWDVAPSVAASNAAVMGWVLLGVMTGLVTGSSNACAAQLGGWGYGVGLAVAGVCALIISLA